MNQIQERILDIFVEIKKICETYHITYFAIGGSCIGAVRHQGFIPWDDDLDIAIPIEQFSKFKEIAKKELPSYLEVYSCDEVVHYNSVFMKVVDKRTTFIEEYQYKYPDAYKGVFVDIMPISGVPCTKLKRKLFCFKRSFFDSVNMGIRFDEYEPKHLTMQWVVSVVRLLKKFIPYSFFSMQYLKMLEKHPFFKANCVGYVWSNSVRKFTFPKKYFNDTVEIQFESTSIACPIGWKEYLTQQFGDYMKLPPKEQQVSMHAGVVDLEHSFLDYQSGKYKIKGEE